MFTFNTKSEFKSWLNEHFITSEQQVIVGLFNKLSNQYKGDKIAAQMIFDAVQQGTPVYMLDMVLPA